MDIQAILDVIVSHAMASGYFETVNGHEPKSAPGNGITCGVWSQEIGPAPSGSGLAATTALVVWNVRLYTSMLAEPQDAIDPQMMLATSALIGAYSGDFQLGSTARNVDLLGQAGTPLRARAGYQTIDNKIFRIMNIDLPVLVNDAWQQVA
jgi:hypothetical protein